METENAQVDCVSLEGWVEHKSYLEKVRWLVGMGGCGSVDHLTCSRDR